MGKRSLAEAAKMRNLHEIADLTQIHAVLVAAGA
jgi:hypothetical protein